MKLDANEGRMWLEAYCRTIGGDFKRTSVEIQGIANIDGQLKRERKRASSFQNSCRDITMKWQEDRVQLIAVCRTIAGSERWSVINLTHIHNIDGKLTISR